MIRLRWSMIWYLVLSVLLVACAGTTPTPEQVVQPTPVGEVTVEPSAIPSVPTEMPTATSQPSPTDRPAANPSSLVILHTNDNWGETEPCG